MPGHLLGLCVRNAVALTDNSMNGMYVTDPFTHPRVGKGQLCQTNIHPITCMYCIINF